MKVLMVTPYTKPIVGGISTYVDGLCNGLRRHNTDCVVVSEKGEGTGGSGRTERSLPRFLSEGILAAFGYKPDVIHAHSNWRALMIALAYKQLFPHVPVFFTFHTDYLSPLAGSKKEILEAMLERCDSLIFTSSYLRLKTRNSLSFKAKSKVIYAGATGKPVSEREVQEFRKRHSLEDKFPVLLYMTPFVWEGKVVGIELLGKSLQSLRRQSLDPKLLVLGDGPLRGRTEERTRRLGFEDVVMFLGRLEDPWTAISACDVYTHISMKESLSMSILEAMSSGKPVIATDVGGTREIISDNSIGALVSPDSAEIEEAIFSLSSNRDRMREMGSKARKWIEARFTWDQSAKNHLKLYREAIDEA